MGSFRTNQSALHKQGWAFIYSRRFQRVRFSKKKKKKKHLDDCSKYYTENYVHGTTFREL